MGIERPVRGAAAAYEPGEAGRGEAIESVRTAAAGAVGRYVRDGGPDQGQVVVPVFAQAQDSPLVVAQREVTLGDLPVPV